MGRLAGKSVIITGGGLGIGRASAILFAKEGARVAVADINTETAKETVRLIQDAAGEAIFLQTDVTNEENVESSVRATVEAFGKLDVLYNNAGMSTAQDGPITDVSTEEFWKTISLNLFGTWTCTRYAIPEMIKGGGGSIVNTISTAALMGMKGLDAFTAAKGAVASLTRSVAVEYAPYKIRVNAIAPTMILTERVVRLSHRQVSKDTENQALLGPGQPIEIGYMALYLASDESRITTGQIFAVDSGVLVS